MNTDQVPDGTDTSATASQYGSALSDYLHSGSEDALYRASLLSSQFVEAGFGPEDIIALHFEALERAQVGMSPRAQMHAVTDAHQFLLEVMIAYGVKYREFLDLRLRESLREAEDRTRREREHALELERTKRESAELLAHIAHELGTPITAAKGSIDLAMRSISRGRMERLSPLLDQARQAMERLSRLTAELVQSSQAGSPEVERQPLLIRPITDQAYAWARAAAMAKGLSMHYLPPADRVRVLGNADALLSVFGNLLSNAIRYTSSGGTVTLRCSSDGAMFWVEVADDGIGMSIEVQGRIFERFYRAPEARRQEAQGLGVGLALVRQMVDAHHGRVEVESAAGAGSIFRVGLPLFVDEKEPERGDEAGGERGSEPGRAGRDGGQAAADHQ